MRQDRNGVRTAQDLERKYDLSALIGMKKAVENSIEGLNKTNTILEDFMASTIGSLDEIQNQLDGNITTWFYGGVPTLANLPASEWTTDEIKNNHLGDLYYDQDTGNAYRFILKDGAYEWIELLDNEAAEALAIANAAKDTADGKRRVFVTIPTTPYDNGDLWLNEGEIYVCQITKAATETFDENDFILATKYTDDTVANQVGDNLEVLRGTVLTVIEDAEKFRAEIASKDEVTQSSIELLKNEFTVKINDTQASLEDVNASLREQLNKITKYFTFDVDGLTIGEVGNPNKIVIDNDAFEIRVGENVVQRFTSDGKSLIPELFNTKKFHLIGYEIEEDEDGNLNCGYVGEVE